VEVGRAKCSCGGDGGHRADAANITIQPVLPAGCDFALWTWGIEIHPIHTAMGASKAALGFIQDGMTLVIMSSQILESFVLCIALPGVVVHSG